MTNATKTQPAVQDVECFGPFAGDVDEAPAVGNVPADKNVAPERLFFTERAALVNGFHAHFSRLGDGVPANVHRDAFDAHRARVGFLYAGEDFHQRRFARTVISEQGKHFAGIEREVHPVQRYVRAE